MEKRPPLDKINTVLVTGNEGYIGSALVPWLIGSGFHVIGQDIGVFKSATFNGFRLPPHEQRYQDIRDISLSDLAGIDAIVHLAGISNDPLGELDPSLTLEINHLASTRLAQLAKQAGIKRFIFSSSCSIYGASGGNLAHESSPLAPLTAYALSKARVEKDLASVASSDFLPLVMRNATVFGVSPRLRLDLVVQNLAVTGYLTGIIKVLSDGTPWRPLLHLDDLARAFTLMLTLPAPSLSLRTFNVAPAENTIQIRDLASLVARHLPVTAVSINRNYSPDERSYRVSSQRLLHVGWRPHRLLESGIEEIIAAFIAVSFSDNDNQKPIFYTLKHYQSLLTAGALDTSFRLRQNITI